MKRPDNIIKFDVYDQLGWDLLLDSSRIEVKVDKGVVTLTGAVYTYQEYLEAGEDAAGVSGLVAVRNELQVGPAGEALADETIEAECKARLAATKFVPAGAVTPNVHDGWVTLSGQVRNYFQRVSAKRAVSGVVGVLGVVDDVKISSDPVPSDVADRIRKALSRNALLQGSSVSVSNVRKTIYLDGTVTSYKAKLEAEAVAWGAPGVDEVVNRTKVVV